MTCAHDYETIEIYVEPLHPGWKSFCVMRCRKCGLYEGDTLP